MIPLAKRFIHWITLFSDCIVFQHNIYSLCNILAWMEIRGWHGDEPVDGAFRFSLRWADGGIRIELKDNE